MHVWEVTLNSDFFLLDRNGTRNKLDKLLKERKGIFPLLIKVRGVSCVNI